MQLDQKMLQKILQMNDEQLSSFVSELARGAGINPSELGMSTENMNNLRNALGSATNNDLDRLNDIYKDYRKNRRQ